MNNQTLRELKEAFIKFGKMGAKELVKQILFVAEVVDIQTDTCSIQYNTLKLTNVRLCAIKDGNKSKLIVRPKVGSDVLVFDMSGGDLTDLLVLQVTDVEDIQTDKGSNGGLIQIEKLTDKINEVVDSLNDLIEAFNGHTHATATVIGQVTVSGTATKIAIPSIKASKLKSSDYENPKIKH
ncbi:MAG TPA: hypothetical protein P5243_07655 [Bacteroidales bacterium]|jgi:hypothetical protein|nr:hypothetical protein [Bacteroidales bacterium]